VQARQSRHESHRSHSRHAELDPPRGRSRKDRPQDFTADEVYYERGIDLLHGYLTEYYVEDASFVFPLPRMLQEVGVLLAPVYVKVNGSQ
jgi:hypothetical protein